MASREIRKKRLLAIIDYVEAWQQAQVEYWNWFRGTCQTKLRVWKILRKRAREQIVEAVLKLDYGKDGRVRNDTVAARQKIRTFRKRQDKILGRLIVRGRKLFGMDAKIDPDTGLYIGGFDKSLKKQASDQVLKAFARVGKTIETHKDILNA